MPADVLGNELTEGEALLLEVYEGLKRLCDDKDLPPTAAFGVLTALAQLAQPVVSLGLAYEHLSDRDV